MRQGPGVCPFPKHDPTRAEDPLPSGCWALTGDCHARDQGEAPKGGLSTSTKPVRQRRGYVRVALIGEGARRQRRQHKLGWEATRSLTPRQRLQARPERPASSKIRRRNRMRNGWALWAGAVIGVG